MKVPDVRHHDMYHISDEKLASSIYIGDLLQVDFASRAITAYNTFVMCHSILAMLTLAAEKASDLFIFHFIMSKTSCCKHSFT